MEVASNVLSDMSSITKEFAAKLMLTANSLMQLLVFVNPAILDIRSVLMVAAPRQI
jgi:hypothetical protein